MRALEDELWELAEHWRPVTSRRLRTSWRGSLCWLRASGRRKVSIWEWRFGNDVKTTPTRLKVAFLKPVLIIGVAAAIRAIGGLA